MGCSRFALALVAMVTTAACREGVDIVVTQNADQIGFATDPVDADFAACIERAYLYSEQTPTPQQLWYATRGSAREPCIRTLRYGPDPQGFSADPPPALERGARYRVELVGNGFTASTSFTRQ